MRPEAGFARLGLARLGLAHLVLVAAWVLPVPAARAEPVADFMVMEVCLDPDGAILAGTSPIDATCGPRRKIAGGEVPPYRLRNWPPGNGDCAGGLIVKYNVPVIRDDVTRIVSFSNHADGCDTNDGAEVARGLSVQWHDDQFGFIMASWSPVAMSSFQSPLCSAGSGGPERFYRGWVIAPETLPEPGKPGWGVFPSHLTTGPAPGPSDACPERFASGLTVWIVDDMVFGAGSSETTPLRAVVSHHYSRSSLAGDGPGAAMQMERTYWTREFGLTRWEKWARDDWTNPRSQRPATELAHSLFARLRCNRPYALPAQVTPHMQSDGLTGDGFWRQTLHYAANVAAHDAGHDAATAKGHGWVMTLCEDYTNLARTPPPANVLADAARIDSRYWQTTTSTMVRHP